MNGLPGKTLLSCDPKLILDARILQIRWIFTELQYFSVQVYAEPDALQ